MKRKLTIIAGVFVALAALVKLYNWIDETSC